MIRLLNTPISGPWEPSVASSRIDMVGGLSGSYILRMPPRFWAGAASLTASMQSSARAANGHSRNNGLIEFPRLQSLRASVGLPVEPHDFHAPAVVEAVDHDLQPLHLRLPTGRLDVVIDDWPSRILLKLSVDLPHQLLALFLVHHRRLLVELLVELGIAIAAVVPGRAAGVVLVELLVRVVDAAASAVLCHGIVLAGHLRMPVGALNRLQYAVDVNLLQLIDQDHRRVAKAGDV